MRPNNKKQIFEPVLPLTREGGLLERCEFAWQNAPVIQMGTKMAWWGNGIGTRTVGSEYAETPEGPVQADGQFLARRESLANAALQQVQDAVPEIESFTTEATNPYGDRIEVDATFKVQGVAEKVILQVSPPEAEEGGTPPTFTGIKDIINDGVTPGVKDIINDGVTPGYKDVINDG